MMSEKQKQKIHKYQKKIHKYQKKINKQGSYVDQPHSISHWPRKFQPKCTKKNMTSSSCCPKDVCTNTGRQDEFNKKRWCEWHGGTYSKQLDTNKKDCVWKSGRSKKKESKKPTAACNAAADVGQYCESDTCTQDDDCKNPSAPLGTTGYCLTNKTNPCLAPTGQCFGQKTGAYVVQMHSNTPSDPAGSTWDMTKKDCKDFGGTWYDKDSSGTENVCHWWRLECG